MRLNMSLDDAVAKKLKVYMVQYEFLTYNEAIKSLLDEFDLSVMKLQDKDQLTIEKFL